MTGTVFPSSLDAADPVLPTLVTAFGTIVTTGANGLPVPVGAGLGAGGVGDDGVTGDGADGGGGALGATVTMVPGRTSTSTDVAGVVTASCSHHRHWSGHGGARRSSHRRCRGHRWRRGFRSGRRRSGVRPAFPCATGMRRRSLRGHAGRSMVRSPCREAGRDERRGRHPAHGRHDAGAIGIRAPALGHDHGVHRCAEYFAPSITVSHLPREAELAREEAVLQLGRRGGWRREWPPEMAREEDVLQGLCTGNEREPATHGHNCDNNPLRRTRFPPASFGVERPSFRGFYPDVRWKYRLRVSSCC
jgi:hypothetical protein